MQTTISEGPVHCAKVMEVVVVLVNRGKGILEDPVRIVTQYWSIDGEFLAEKDGYGPTMVATFTTTFPSMEAK